jgi:hypothetical protein
MKMRDIPVPAKISDSELQNWDWETEATNIRIPFCTSKTLFV